MFAKKELAILLVLSGKFQTANRLFDQKRLNALMTPRSNEFRTLTEVEYAYSRKPFFTIFYSRNF